MDLSLPFSGNRCKFLNFVEKRETLVGKLSTEDRDQFTAFGQAVNLASRLEEGRTRSDYSFGEYKLWN